MKKIFVKYLAVRGTHIFTMEASVKWNIQGRIASQAQMLVFFYSSTL